MRKTLLTLFLGFAAALGYGQATVTTTQNFDVALGFTDIGGSAPATAWSSQTAGTNPTCSPQAGAGMARFNSFAVGTGLYRTLSTPVIDYSVPGCATPNTISFWIYRDNGYAGYPDSITVLINTSQSLTGAAYLGSVARVRTFNLPDTKPADGWFQYTFNIPPSFNGPTNYILLTGSSEYGNNIFIDEVSWTRCVNSCSGTPSAGTISGQASVCSGRIFQLTNTGASPLSAGLTYNWQTSSSAAGPWTNIPGQTDPAVGTVSQTSDAYYRFVDTCGGIPAQSAVSNILHVTMNAVADCPCLPAPTNCTDNDLISNVTFGSINNNSTCSPDGYGDFTGLTPASVAQGSAVPISVSLDPASTVFTDYIAVWIDYNQNGIFENSEFTALGSGIGVTLSGTINVPLTANPGNCRMRVRDRYNTALTGADACLTYTYGETEDYTVNITATSACSGTPTAGTITGPAQSCNGVGFSLTSSGATVAAGMHYAWQSSLDNSTWTNIPGQTSATSAVASLATATYYRLVDTCINSGLSAISNVIQVTLSLVGCPPPNDDPCNAITLILNGAADCQNTALAAATSATDPAAFNCSTPNNTVWYTYTPAASGYVQFTLQPPASGDTLNGWIGVYVSPTLCPGLTLVDSTTTTLLNCTPFGDNDAVGGVPQGDTSFSIYLTAGKKYYFMIDGVSGDVGQYCISIQSPPPPPPCTTNISPANAATGVTGVVAGIPITWNAAAGATSYDIYFGTVNPPANIGNTAATTATITNTNFNTTYYWYVVPINLGGRATGCVSNVTSFTTQLLPANCIPAYSTGCTLDDLIDSFSLKGENGVTLYNISGLTCSAAPIAYSDYTSVTPVVTLSTGNSYSGVIAAGTTGDYASVWIDFNDDLIYDNAERLLSNLPLSGTTGNLYSIYIPTTANPGNHRMRVRLVYYGATRPTAATDPCSNYTYGETEDYTVNITAAAAALRSVAAGNPGNCSRIATTTIDNASNNTAGTVALIDSSNNRIADLYPDGNNLGVVNTSLFINNGPVRLATHYYLDRNFTITPTIQPTTAYRLRCYYKTSELNTLIAQSGSLVSTETDLKLTKNSDPCSATVQTSNGTLFTPSGFGSYGTDKTIDFTGLTGFSSFYLHGGNTVVPITLLNFNAQRVGRINNLTWSTSQELNTRQFVVERSNDGHNFISLGQVAAAGSSTTTRSYALTDNNPVKGINYYRLRIVDVDNSSKYSLVRSIRNEGTADVSIYPNPVRDMLTLNITSDETDRAVISVTDLIGRLVYSRSANISKGANNFDINTHNLSAGSYQVRIQLTNDVITEKINKQ